MFRHSFRRIAKLTVVSASPNTYSVPPHTHTQSRSLRLAHLLCYSPLLTSSGTDYNQQMHENRVSVRGMISMDVDKESNRLLTNLRRDDQSY